MHIVELSTAVVEVERVTNAS